MGIERITSSTTFSGELGPPPTLDPQRHALFLDIDGTLVELARTPGEVTADAALSDLLARLSDSLDGALAVLTGRSIAEADRILRGAVAHVGGLHGAQLRDGTRQMTSDVSSPADWNETRAAVRRLISTGVIDAELEDKGSALALHYRHAPAAAASVKAAADDIAGRYGLRVLHGKMVAELLPHGDDKGTAVTAFMRTSPFAGRVPIAIGDDVTDEDAFAVANDLGGVSILVGARRPTAARHNLPSVEAVREWLAEAVAS